MEVEFPIGSELISKHAGILIMILLGLLLSFLILKFCQLRHDEIQEAVPPPPVRQFYRHTPGPPTRFQDDDGYYGFSHRGRPESTTAMMAIYYNYHLTEVLVTNPHVFILFCLPVEFCPFSGSLLTLLGEAAEELQRSPRDGVRRVIAATNCSTDPSMATKHNVHQYPTLSYFRKAIYHCDYTGNRSVPALVQFLTTIVMHRN